MFMLGNLGMEVPAFTAAIEAHQQRITDAILERALQICAEKNVIPKTKVVIGDPKEKICEVVDKLHADLLVMGNRAFGPLKRFFLGSVSKYCSNHASCPVVIVKGEDGVVMAHNEIILAITAFPLLPLAASDQIIYDNTDLQSVYSKYANVLEFIFILLYFKKRDPTEVRAS
ncbi:hypothetical protein V2J09_008514 [Rumex salicifolius]